MDIYETHADPVHCNINSKEDRTICNKGLL